MYGITTLVWGDFLEDALEITLAIALQFQAETHKYTQEAILYKMWKTRNKAKHGSATLEVGALGT